MPPEVTEGRLLYALWRPRVYHRGNSVELRVGAEHRRLLRPPLRVGHDGEEAGSDRDVSVLVQVLGGAARQCSDRPLLADDIYELLRLDPNEPPPQERVPR